MSGLLTKFFNRCVYQPESASNSGADNVIKAYCAELSVSPLDKTKHYEYATAALNVNLFDIAHAELRNAEFLGYNVNKTQALQNKINGFLSDLTVLDVNQYQRFATLQSHINKLVGKGDSVLDIGGGHGKLSQFIPDCRYFLIEPSVNGISGLKLPFKDNSFDVVVTCHVLEHIEFKNRIAFIEELIRVAKKNVLVYNPFVNEMLDDNERMQLILDVTGAEWAKEHLDCGLPKLQEVTDYLSSNGISFTTCGYGDIYASLSTVFMSHYAAKSATTNISDINRHLNTCYDPLSASQYPTNIMIEIRV